MNSKDIRKQLLGAGSALRVLAMVGAGAAATGIAITPAAAQDYTNVTASGRVVGADGTAIPNATVTITSDDQGTSRTVTANSSGTYRIPQLAPGSYTFTVSAPGYQTYTEAGVDLSQTGAANQFALVAEGAAAEGDAIVVTGTRTVVPDFDQTTTGSVVNVADLSSRVPVGRDLTSIIELAPGVAGGDSAFGNLASAVGSSVSENVFYVNGLNITEFREGLGSVTVPFEFYQTVEVKNGGYPAEFGRATGAFVNATTKSGSNDFHASVKALIESPKLRSHSPDTLTRDNDFATSERAEMIIQASGPIWKDHVFFYGLYNPRKVSSRFATTSPDFVDPVTGDLGQELQGVNPNFAYYDKTDSPFYAGKLDVIVVDGQRLEFTYFNTSGTTVRRIHNYLDNETNTVGDLSTVQRTQYGGENFVGRYTGQITDFLTLSGAYGKNKNRDNALPENTTLPYVSDERSGTAQSIGNPVNGITTQEDEREFYRADIDLYVNLLGSHHFKAGYDRENLTSVNTLTYTGGSAYTLLRASATNDYGLAPGTEYVEARTFVNGGTFKSKNEAFYIEDNWSLLNDRLSLNIGARNDRFTNRNVNGDVYYDSGDNWQPRLGFTFDTFNDGRSKLYGSFGRYYLPIATNTNIRLGGAELDYDELYLLNGLNSDNTPILGGAIANQPCFDGGGTNCVLRSDGQAAPLESVVASNLENQSVDEYILGFEQRIGSRWTVGIYGTYRNLNASLEDAAIDQGILTYCADNGITDCGGGAYFGANQYALINPGEPVTIVPAAPLDGSLDPITLSPEQLGYPAAKRDYKAITFTFEREFDGVWSLSGSYTYSKNKGNIEGGVKSDNGQTDSGLSTDFDFPSLMLGSYGYLPNDRRHNFKVYGSYAPFDWLELGANLRIVSPRRFGCLGRVADSVSSRALILAGESFDYGYAYGDAGHFCVVDGNGEIVTDPTNPGGADRSVVARGSSFKSDWDTGLDLDVKFKLPSDEYDVSLRFTVINVFNSSAALDYNELGTSPSGAPRADYGAITRYQEPRSVRVQLEMGF